MIKAEPKDLETYPLEQGDVIRFTCGELGIFRGVDGDTIWYETFSKTGAGFAIGHCPPYTPLVSGCLAPFALSWFNKDEVETYKFKLQKNIIKIKHKKTLFKMLNSADSLVQKMAVGIINEQLKKKS